MLRNAPMLHWSSHKLVLLSSRTKFKNCTLHWSFLPRYHHLTHNASCSCTPSSHFAKSQRFLICHWRKSVNNHFSVLSWILWSRFFHYQKRLMEFFFFLVPNHCRIEGFLANVRPKFRAMHGNSRPKHFSHQISRRCGGKVMAQICSCTSFTG